MASREQSKINCKVDAAWQLLCPSLHALMFVGSNSVTPWTVTHQAPLSMGFSKREYWTGLPCPSPGNLSKFRQGLKEVTSGLRQAYLHLAHRKLLFCEDTRAPYRNKTCARWHVQEAEVIAYFYASYHMWLSQSAQSVTRPAPGRAQVAHHLSQTRLFFPFQRTKIYFQPYVSNVKHSFTRVKPSWKDHVRKGLHLPKVRAAPSVHLHWTSLVCCHRNLPQKLCIFKTFLHLVTPDFHILEQCTVVIFEMGEKTFFCQVRSYERESR